MAEGDDRACMHALLSGRVQGVGFRWFARERARELGVGGWIENLSDGRVEVWIEGPPERVRSMLAWLDQGPPTARVEKLDVREEMPAGLDSFEVQRVRSGPR
jgi:acylphosphatase